VSWNIETLTENSIEFVKALHGHRMITACVRENKWVGVKVREIDGFKL